MKIMLVKKPSRKRATPQTTKDDEAAKVARHSEQTTRLKMISRSGRQRAVRLPTSSVEAPMPAA